ncbi:M13 family metallopeptidase [Colwellia psychrerythraea]|uniref:Neprilysin n=1 Tax=Colwellia psychrerythraea TaxID=28229 RepID=A0A099KHV8_COLPS|nr:M13-type metalloendopeptidase [Colwellia psychrerythraea]KGJ89168.1 Neprilysin [Colwellia psychrerythraea]
MKKTLVSLTVLIGLMGCNNSNSLNAENDENSRPVLISGLDISSIDATVKPGDDFNLYANGNWIKKTEIPADKSSYGIGTMVHEQSQSDVRAIIEAASSGDFPRGSNEQKVGDLYQSYIDWDTRNEIGLTPIHHEFSQIDAITNYEELAIHFAVANKLGYSIPFNLGQYVDFKDPSSYMRYTWQSGLGLPDREYYSLTDDISKELRVSYLLHIEKMLTLAGLANPAAAAKDIFDLETKLANQQMKKEQTRDMVALYNKIPTANLTEIMPDFNWDGFLAQSGISDIDGVVVTQMDYMKALNDIIKDTPIYTWHVYLKWGVVNSTATRLNQALDQQNFEFYGKTMRGVKTQQPMWRRGVNIVNQNIGEVVGKVYVKKHFPPQAKARMEELVTNLTKAYKVSIENLDWMTPETKKQALDKLSKFTPKIGYPDVWKDYSALTIKKDDLFGNLKRSALVVYQQGLDKQNGPVQKHEWAMTPQTVNAYYNPPLNEIVFPAAILQPPYFNLNAEDAVNYGAIGAVIGHEIGHGFDDAGSAFDGNGVLRNWWTDADKAEFKNRTAKLVAQYDEFEPLKDVHVNGTFTLGENIGDLGGLSISLMAYKMSLAGKTAPVIDDFSGEQRVFLGYAQSWSKKYREKALKHQISTDPHSPAMYRVNGVVRNVPEFYQLFDVKEGDKLYLNPKQRVKIW